VWGEEGAVIYVRVILCVYICVYVYWSFVVGMGLDFSPRFDGTALT
jgi:hypothetical protein